MARIVVVLGLALMIFGPRDLPRLALTLWRTAEDLRRALVEFADSFRRELEVLEREEATHPPNA